MKRHDTEPENIHTHTLIDSPIKNDVLTFDPKITNEFFTAEQQVVFNKAAEELTLPHITELRSGERRREIRYHVLNNNDETTRDFVLMLGWGQSVEDGDTGTLLQYLAALHPNTRWIVPTTPGLDDTDRLPPEILSDFKKGSFTRAGDYLLKGIRSELRDNVPHDIGGYSQGASFATGIAASSEQDEFRNVKVFDPAALQRRTIIGMLIASQRSGSHIRHTITEEDAPQDHKKPGTKHHISRYELGKLHDSYIRLPAALGKAGLLFDALKAAPKLKGTIEAFIADESEYTTHLNKTRRALAHSAVTLSIFDGNHGTIPRNPSSLAQFLH